MNSTLAKVLWPQKVSREWMNPSRPHGQDEKKEGLRMPVWTKNQSWGRSIYGSIYGNLTETCLNTSSQGYIEWATSSPKKTERLHSPLYSTECQSAHKHIYPTINPGKRRPKTLNSLFICISNDRYNTKVLKWQDYIFSTKWYLTWTLKGQK